MGQFKPMVKMMTTEPSVELKLKKGGHVQRKADGGMPTGAGMGNRMPMAAMPSERGIPAAARRGVAPKMTVPRGGMRGPMMRKKGGEVESKSMHKAEMAEMKGIKKELKSHEDKPASKAHKGLKTGGAVPAYKTGGVIEKYATGGVIQKFKKGGLQDDGKAVKYPKVPATKPPYVTKLADTHKKGGRIAKKAYGGSC
jgi:hypothetical protein